MASEFLHLEDKHCGGLDIKALLNQAGQRVEGDEVLQVMRDFYKDLY